MLSAAFIPITDFAIIDLDCEFPKLSLRFWPWMTQFEVPQSRFISFLVVVGSPHCVAFVDDEESISARQWECGTLDFESASLFFVDDAASFVDDSVGRQDIGHHFGDEETLCECDLFDFSGVVSEVNFHFAFSACGDRLTFSDSKFSVGWSNFDELSFIVTDVSRRTGVDEPLVIRLKFVIY